MPTVAGKNTDGNSEQCWGVAVLHVVTLLVELHRTTLQTVVSDNHKCSLLDLLIIILSSCVFVLNIFSVLSYFF